MVAMIPETTPDFDHTRIIERPDGFYWQDAATNDEYGPFPTLVDAVADMEFSAASDYEPGESLEQAENEVGLAEWVDPDTGEFAENGTPRLEEH